MQSNEKIIEIGKFLPYGSKKTISEISGISVQTVVGFFRTGKAKEETAIKILKVAQPFFVEAQRIKKAKEELLNSMTME